MKYKTILALVLYGSETSHLTIKEERTPWKYLDL